MATPRATPTTILGMTASELARQIASGAISAREAVDAHIARIEAVNPKLNAVVVKLYDEARAAAASADAARARGEWLGPLHGVPITIKESFDVAGTPTTAGLTHRAKHRAEQDAFHVARLRKAGAIPLGKTNVPQLLLMNESDNPLYGRTNNPWDLARTPGGSSGGEAAIIAAGGSALGLGSDIGGSVRLPASACGICSLLPTARRLTFSGHIPVIEGQEIILPQAGPMARSVADLALAMRVLAAPGQDAVDPTIPPVAWRDPAGVEIRRLRVAFFTDNGFLPASPAFRRAVRMAATTLREHGADVEEWSLPSAANAWRIYLGLLMADGAKGLRRALGRSKADWRVSRFLKTLALPRGSHVALRWLLKAFGQKHLASSVLDTYALSTAEYWQLVEERNRYAAGFFAALDAGRFDAIVCPADGLPAMLHGASYYLSSALSYTTLFNLLGMPAGVVPATRVRKGEESDRADSRDMVIREARRVEQGSAGLPIGVQVAGRAWREDVVLALMAALEEHFRTLPDFPANPPI